MVSAKLALSGAVAASVAFAQSTVVEASTEVDVSTEIATVTSCSAEGGCTGAPTVAPTEAPIQNSTTPAQSTVVAASTVVDQETELVTVTHCTGSDVVSCHHVTSTPVPAPATTAPPAGNISTPVVAPSSSADLTTYVTVSEGVTLTKTAPCETPEETGAVPSGPASNGTGNTTAPAVSSGPEQVSGQSVLQVGVAGVAIAAVGALLI
ncbi:hypothetical protein TRICI_002856 [Trichomonascus ciferrii]|uniref:GPI anchored serine-rich protein n=1 Tax=Trichomonascus ciferrii TaxID=44093 RepID=A0A642V4T2_9ASCO|nr:hypothetical protein TRICI_002856 [Trichomonascus ciferrii]